MESNSPQASSGLSSTDQEISGNMFEPEDIPSLTTQAKPNWHLATTTYLCF